MSQIMPLDLGQVAAVFNIDPDILFVPELSDPTDLANAELLMRFHEASMVAADPTTSHHQALASLGDLAHASYDASRYGTPVPGSLPYILLAGELSSHFELEYDPGFGLWYPDDGK